MKHFGSVDVDVLDEKLSASHFFLRRLNDGRPKEAFFVFHVMKNCVKSGWNFLNQKSNRMEVPRLCIFEAQ